MLAGYSPCVSALRIAGPSPHKCSFFSWLKCRALGSIFCSRFFLDVEVQGSWLEAGLRSMSSGAYSDAATAFSNVRHHSQALHPFLFMNPATHVGRGRNAGLACVAEGPGVAVPAVSACGRLVVLHVHPVLWCTT